MSLATIRNIAIILAIAAIIALAPGGGTAANVVIVAVTLAFLAAAAWVASMLYRERRGSLELLGDARRGILYGAAVVIGVCLTATHRMWQSSLGSVAWLVLLGVSIYACFAVMWSARRY
ncbi:MAG: hypothetical protein ACRDNJ_12875 [Solirubrobacteraceae bacterium]